MAGFWDWLWGRPSTDDQIGLEDYIEIQTPESWEGVMGDNRPRKEPGIYAWFFDCVIPAVCTAGCFRDSSWTLLYVGKATNLRTSICSDHFRGNAEGSTLRLTLGCLLRDTLPAELSVTWRGRWTLGRNGEKLFSEWMRFHARVTWASLHDKSIDWPYVEGETIKEVLDRAERRLIKNFRPPLNLDHNDEVICGDVRRIREQCQQAARR